MDCQVNFFSSRVCELGTKGCVVQHVSWKEQYLTKWKTLKGKSSEWHDSLEGEKHLSEMDMIWKMLTEEEKENLFEE